MLFAAEISSPCRLLGELTCYTRGLRVENFDLLKRKMAAREHFFYGAVVGAGAVALGAGVFVGTLHLWRTLRQVWMLIFMVP